MAAGQGFKTFTTGEVLTAGDVNGYLMQGINVFTNATARDAAITAPAEGQFAFTKDNNSLWYYDGATWVASGATGDIEGVTAGVGISGGGTSGTVTVTNSMATAIDAKGDLVPGTGADTFARLAVGANDTVLTADSSTATGLKWATPSAGGGMTLLSTTTASGASTTVSSISGAYKELKVYLLGLAYNSNDNIFFRPNGNSAITSYSGVNYTPVAISTMNGDMNIGANVTAGLALRSIAITIDNYASASHYKSFLSYGIVNAGDRPALIAGSIGTTAAITSFTIAIASGSFTGGTILVYGVN